MMAEGSDEPFTKTLSSLRFPVIAEVKKEEVKRAITELSSNRNWSFNLTKFTYCNANSSSCFSEASSTFTKSTDPGVQNRFHLYPFSDVFYTGCNVLRSYLSDDTFVPQEKAEHIALRRLLSVVNRMEDICLRLEGVPKENETAFTLSLVHHLLKELAVNQEYIIDSQSELKRKLCPCGCLEKITGSYGDTSIGHIDTWHGAVDVLLGNQSVAVGIYPIERTADDEYDEEEDEEEQFGQLCALEIKEAKRKSFTNQMIAETVVFAFLQSQRCPEFKTFLIPTIGISRKRLIFLFYDPVNDIFLETGTQNLFCKIDAPKMMQMPTVLALWFTINYKYFCSGISKPMQDRNFHSDFLSQLSEERKELFKKGLHYGNCHRHANALSIRRRDPIWILIPGSPADASFIA